MNRSSFKAMLGRAAGALLLAGAVTGPAAAQPAMQTPTEALEQDAREFAAQSGLAPEEALQRLRFQEESVAATDRLRSLYAKRLAGLSIEQRPEHSVVVLLTGKKKVPAQTITAGGRSVPVVFRTGAEATEALRVRQSFVHCLSGSVLMDGDDCGNAAAFGVDFADAVAGSFRSLRWWSEWPRR